MVTDLIGLREAKLGQDVERLLPTSQRCLDALSVLESYAQKVQRATLAGSVTKLPINRQGALNAMDSLIEPVQVTIDLTKGVKAAACTQAVIKLATDLQGPVIALDSFVETP